MREARAGASHTNKRLVAMVTTTAQRAGTLEQPSDGGLAWFLQNEAPMQQRATAKEVRRLSGAAIK